MAQSRTTSPEADEQASPEPAARPRLSTFHFLRPGPGTTAALVLAVLAAAALPLAAPHLTRRFVDDAIAGAATAHLLTLAAGYLALVLTGQAARLATVWVASRLAWDGTNNLRERLAEHALRLDMDYHGAHTPGEMIERVDGDVTAVADFAVAFIVDVVVGALLLAGVLAVVFTLDVRLGAALLVYCLLLGFAMMRVQRLATPSAAEAREQSAAVIGGLEEHLTMAEDIRANGAGAHVVNRFHRASAGWFRADYRASTVGSALIAGTSVAFAAGTALMLALAAWGRVSGVLTVGTAVLLFQYMLMVRTPFERLIDQLRQYQGALAGMARAGALLAEPRTLPPPADPRPLPGSGPLSLHLDGVGFAYPDDGARVLAGVTITLKPGETLGLVGRTGSGKTTIARLILRLYDPTAGAVRVGGIDLRDTDPASLRRRVGVVTQDVQLFAADVRDNLTLFRPGTDDSRLREILGEVGLGEWLAALPNGLDTRVDHVSAGEAQLLAFARAFLADPGLVVLDEASSRLDPATERHIERCVDRLLTGRTGVLIAHRLTSLSRVDKIAVVSDGAIVEYGYRRDLAADPGSRFSRMLELAGAGR
ncbi:ABC transporter ATP-binding protein [Sinosporangium siamense]|uniref:Helicase n=1 Tax=Sinosporangium siamense TaxID=1367973 RepID=A0A919RQQ6_9ACTN|nr:ABC transporter ATP-binding protein [Sinosporangium siamense]GII96959.1 helicase [Sinosporangium siamense]